MKDQSTFFTVLAYRVGRKAHSFPIGVFTSLEMAERAAKSHKFYRGGKYNHRIFKFITDKWDDDVGHVGIGKPCIEEIP